MSGLTYGAPLLAGGPRGGVAYAYEVRFSFMKRDDAAFRILRHEGERKGEVMTRTTEPANWKDPHPRPASDAFGLTRLA